VITDKERRETYRNLGRLSGSSRLIDGKLLLGKNQIVKGESGITQADKGRRSRVERQALIRFLGSELERAKCQKKCGISEAL